MKGSSRPFSCVLLAPAAIAAIVVCIGSSTALHAQISDAEIEDLLTLGRTDKHGKLVYECTAKRLSNAEWYGVIGATMALKDSFDRKTSYAVSMMSNRGFIARQAREAARANATFTAAEVKAEWHEPALYVVISPVLPSERSKNVPKPPEPMSDVLFRNYPGKTQQLNKAGAFTSVPRTWRNAAGATLDYTENLAIYNPQRVAGLHRYEGDPRDGSWDLIVMADSGERVCPAINVDRLKGLLKQNK